MTDEAVRATPKWKRGRSPIPLSASRAIILADHMRIQLLKDYHVSQSYDRWELERLSLVPFDEGYWYWTVSFSETTTMLGKPFYIEIPVLMDGTVVVPENEPRIN